MLRIQNNSPILPLKATIKLDYIVCPFGISKAEPKLKWIKGRKNLPTHPNKKILFGTKFQTGFEDIAIPGGLKIKLARCGKLLVRKRLLNAFDESECKA
jgi:hypothetical protein